jgi:N-hydroxyarylamine O-acetyltransferase
VLRIEIAGESWLADVGFGGCVLTAPLRLAFETVQETAHDAYRLMPHPEGASLEVLRDGVWITAWELSFEPCTPADYEMANWYTSTFPTSHFRHNLLAGLTTPQARHALLFNRYTVRPVGGQPVRAILSADEIETTLRDVFGLPVEPSWRPLIARAAATAPD